MAQDDPTPRGPSTPPPPPLPKILAAYPSSASAVLISQGAEGRLYRTTYLDPDLPCALKYRPPKPYRHPTLDARLTRARILAEARVLARCRREGVAVPAVYAIDEVAGWLMMEWVDGVPARAAINTWLSRRKPSSQGTQELQQSELQGRAGQLDTESKGTEGLAKTEAQGTEKNHTGHAPLVDLMRRIGAAVANLHRVGVIHGDLTTSNMMLRPWTQVSDRTSDLAGAARDPNSEGQDATLSRLLDGDIVLVDFGLATQSSSEEDRAVDLYVLERAFGSTHPMAEVLFDQTVLQAYRETFKQAGPVLRKLEDVRLRGRKRTMLG
ncbi:hypothetical protein VTK73DRAFT_5096 [Phialemonium thermophilum]|uniref:EKC/KEOPS complex subunit BUD32 n=1 Tax=Phialemonium thermophilum TaxID=223376 RepID=A0ABR3WQD5_9PEZI